MKIITGKFEAIPPGCVLTIGNFDGVHIGHQKILTEAKNIAARKQTPLVMLTFEPHPLAVLNPKQAPGVLTQRQLKNYLLEKMGVDQLLTLQTTTEFLKLTAEDFLTDYLIEKIAPAVVVEGDDFNFGADRKGGIDTLKRIAAQNSIDVVIVDSQQIRLSTNQTVRVSSTIIRYMLSNGHVADAALALGRPYRLTGKIIPGRGKGKRLGFPTLNMKKTEQLVPNEGVYAGFVNLGVSENQLCCDNQKVQAVFSIGRAETYGGNIPMAIEAHLLEEGISEIREKWMAMDFTKKIRAQEKFNTEKKLAEQIEKDCQQAKHILGK